MIYLTKTKIFYVRLIAAKDVANFAECVNKPKFLRKSEKKSL